MASTGCIDGNNCQFALHMLASVARTPMRTLEEPKSWRAAKTCGPWLTPTKSRAECSLSGADLPPRTKKPPGYPLRLTLPQALRLVNSKRSFAKNRADDPAQKTSVCGPGSPIRFGDLNPGAVEGGSSGPVPGRVGQRGGSGDRLSP